MHRHFCVIHILSTGQKFYVFIFFLELTNVKLLFDFRHDKLEPSKVTCSDPISPISLEAFHILKLCFWLQLSCRLTRSRHL